MRPAAGGRPGRQGERAMSDTRRDVHELIDRLPPTQLTAIAGLLEKNLDAETSALDRIAVKLLLGKSAVRRSAVSLALVFGLVCSVPAQERRSADGETPAVEPGQPPASLMEMLTGRRSQNFVL